MLYSMLSVSLLQMCLWSMWWTHIDCFISLVLSLALLIYIYQPPPPCFQKAICFGILVLCLWFFFFFCAVFVVIVLKRSEQFSLREHCPDNFLLACDNNVSSISVQFHFLLVLIPIKCCCLVVNVLLLQRVLGDCFPSTFLQQCTISIDEYEAFFDIA